jgi:hypothetical protein
MRRRRYMVGGNGLGDSGAFCGWPLGWVLGWPLTLPQPQLAGWQQLVCWQHDLRSQQLV